MFAYFVQYFHAYGWPIIALYGDVTSLCVLVKMHLNILLYCILYIKNPLNGGL